MQIKRITSAERSLVVDLFNQYRVFYKQPSDISLADNYIRERLENNESVIFVAIDQEEGREIPCGFTQLYPAYSSVRAVKNWILNDLYVEQAYRNKGIGEKLTKTAIEFAKANNARFIQLETAIDNQTAQRLYESIGFTKQQPDTGFFVYSLNLG